MSNLIYACWRDPEDAVDEATLGLVADRITPKNLPELPHRAVVDTHDCLSLTGPVGAAVSVGTSAHLGAFAGIWKDWNLPGAQVPDGTFALVRSNESFAEACSDFAGSRTIWYVFNDRYFLASTSQRALVCLLEGLDLNRAALAWFVSSGSLGPSAAWDRRLLRLPRNARLTLNRSLWTLALHTSSVEFRPRSIAAAEARNEMLGVLRDAIQSYDFASANWALPLSGGVDCRFILTALYEVGLRPDTMTWGLASSITEPGNDAYIAKQLSEQYGLRHEYLLTEMSGEAPQQVVDAFLGASGGTTDELSPYLDGLRLWSSLAAHGVDGVIRGDEGFGWIPVKSEQHARTSIGMMLLTDFMDEALAEQLSDGKQTLPDELRRQPDETIAGYRDRLYHSYRIPIGLAGLNDVKAPFVEIASPLLSRRVLEYTRQLPDHLRTDKALFRDVAKSVSLLLPYATMGADDDRNDFLRSASYTRWLEAELGSEIAHRVVPTPFREELLSGIRKTHSPLTPTRSFRSALKRIIPTRWVRAVRAHIGPIPPGRRFLAFRSALATRMVRMLEEDAKVLRSARHSSSPWQPLSREGACCAS